MERAGTPLTTWHMRPVAQFHTQYPYPDTTATTQWHPTAVPGHWQMHEPFQHYVGRMLYRSTFAYAPAPQRRVWLTLGGVFYTARPWLNGAPLGHQAGYFAPHHYDITTQVRPDMPNELLVEVACPEEHDKVGKRLITGVFSHWDSMDATLNPGGIWQPVTIHESGPVRLHDVLLTTQTVSVHQAEVRFQMRYDALATTAAVVCWRWTPANFAGRIYECTSALTLSAGAHQATGLIHVPDPELWWSHDMGHPALYQVTATLLVDDVVSDAVTHTFGIRTFALKQWIPYLNGRRMFMKGSNYPPTDVRLAQVTAERCAHDVQLARECHMNVLRVHAHVAHPALYAAADAQGLLIWQDFPLQWLYDRTIWDAAHHQAQEMVFLLGNHASVVIWCMHNEALYIQSTRDERWLTRLRTYLSVFVWNWNRNVLDSALQQTVARLDTTRPVVRSSGEYAIPLLSKGTDTHFYYGWYKMYGALERWEQLIKLFPDNTRFVTEFGAQSFPNYDSAVRFMDADITKIDWQHLAQKHSFQPEMMSYWLEWRSAPNLQALIDMTQAYQIHIHRHYIDRLRLRKYRPTGGIVPFMFHDANPAVSWSIVDYWRVPKQSYAAMQLAFAPQYVFCVCADHGVIGTVMDLAITVVNDAHVEVPVDVSVALTDPQQVSLMAKQHRLTVPADCMAMQIDELRLHPQHVGTYTLHLRWETPTQTYTQSYAIVIRAETSAKESHHE